MLGQAVFSIATCIVGFGRNCFAPSSIIRPPQPQQGHATYVTKGSGGPFDGIKSDIINSTNFEWWYFDAISKSGDEGVAIWFMNANPTGWGLDLPTSNWMMFHARFADGDALDLILPGNTAILNEYGEGASGVWEGLGASFVGSKDLSQFSLSFDFPGKGIAGIVDVISTSEPRSAIDFAKDTSVDLMNVGGMGWAIPVTCGKSMARVTIGDKEISFENGRGYHDHNWGNTLPAWENWYAINGEVGPFVWTAIEAYKGEEQEPFKTAWLTFEGKPILNTFDQSSLTIRPWGNGTEYPPKGFNPQPLGAIVSFDAGSEGRYEFNMTNRGGSPGLPIGKGLAKWFTSIEGGKVGGPKYTGLGMFEWLDLLI
ncbi:hypothetical protein BKA56DRAFT_738151 [Ilyonectria sp. MPI-CAGE-AT-0026]|nr:hypothetical protein BKA56DRAFT_738151 [Ilyonectria sp. MPI-CAGE-AT-0026]